MCFVAKQKRAVRASDLFLGLRYETKRLNKKMGLRFPVAGRPANAIAKGIVDAVIGLAGWLRNGSAFSDSGIEGVTRLLCRAKISPMRRLP